MNKDLSDFWGRLRKGRLGWVHPEDEFILEREPHSFNLQFPPPAFVGNVHTARVIILAANGGYDPAVTAGEFQTKNDEDRYLTRLAHPSEADWWEVAPYYRGVNYAELIFSGAAAVVNACAYRSRRISEEPDNRKLIKKLPSVRFNRDWLIDVVLPQAENGTRLIVGKRHGLWALPSSVKRSSGFITDPAPVSPHLSQVVWAELKQRLK